MDHATAVVDTPIGRYRIAASERGLTRVAPLQGPPPPDACGRDSGTRHHLDRARAAFEAYFAGARESFDGLTLDPGGTPFQRCVWRALLAIPFGETATYGELARRLEREGAARAVGAANGRNPLAIVVPCHRVVGADGRLTGYAHGLERKRWLLAHEAESP